MKMPMFSLLLFLCWMVMVPSCRGPVQEVCIINDFETDADLDRLLWKCGTLFSLSGDNCPNQSSCLKLDMYAGSYPGVAFKNFPKTWTGFDALAMDICNPLENKGVCRITIRIDDRKKTPPYDDRYNGSFLLKPGMNRITIPFGDLKTKNGRALDRSAIYTFILFTVTPLEKKTLYIDHVRLIRQGSAGFPAF